jgi:hypothetical protein
MAVRLKDGKADMDRRKEEITSSSQSLLLSPY